MIQNIRKIFIDWFVVDTVLDKDYLAIWGEFLLHHLTNIVDYIEFRKKKSVPYLYNNFSCVVVIESVTNA